MIHGGASRDLVRSLSPGVTDALKAELGDRKRWNSPAVGRSCRGILGCGVEPTTCGWPQGPVRLQTLTVHCFLVAFVVQRDVEPFRPKVPLTSVN